MTLGAPKLPLVLPPGEAHCGDVVIADIGIPEAAIEAVEGPHIELLTREPMRALIEPRPADSHKGDYGHVLIVAGSPGKTGAAHLSSMGALKSGAGLVTIATPRSCQAVLAAMAPEYMTVGLDESPDGIALDALEHVLAHPGRRHRGRPGAWAPGAGPSRSCTGCSIERACRWCSMPTRSTRLSESRTSWWGRKGATSSSRRIRANWRA